MMYDLQHHSCIKSNNANKFTLQCYGRTLYSKLHAFAKKDRRRYVHCKHPETRSQSLCPKKANVPTPKQRYSIKPPTEGMDFAVKSPCLHSPLPPPPPPPHGVYIDRCIRCGIAENISTNFDLIE